jgi:VanZ family protein
MNYLRPEHPVQVSQPSGLGRWLFATYVAALVYASLFPITGWRFIDESVFAFLAKPWPRYWSGFDLLTNFLAYLPLGAVLALHWNKTHRVDRSIVMASCTGFAMSLAMEVMQNFLPSRVPSFFDLMLNTLGAFSGALIAIAQTNNLAKLKPLQATGRNWIMPSGRWAGIALLVWILIQVLGQSALFMTGEIPPALIADGLTWWGMDQTEATEWAADFRLARFGSSYGAILSEVSVVALNIFIVTTLVCELTTSRAARLPMGLVVIGTALTLKTLFSTRLPEVEPLYWLTVGAQAGLLVGALCALLAAELRSRWRLVGCAVACIGLIVIANLLPANHYQADLIERWRDGHWRSLTGMLRHAALVWPFAMAVICLFLATRRAKRKIRS